jgi:hypothetical protein
MHEHIDGCLKAVGKFGDHDHGMALSEMQPWVALRLGEDCAAQQYRANRGWGLRLCHLSTVIIAAGMRESSKSP